jgi:hypothetical protein
MASLTVGQKAIRVLKLLLGLRHPLVATVLIAHGFDDAELEKGHRLLHNLTRGRLKFVPMHADSPPVVFLNEWENKWYPIAYATLLGNYPELHAIVFLNLVQTSGVEVVVSVGTLIERFAELPEDARALLQKRGLTDEVIGQAKEQLARIEKIAKDPGKTVVDTEADAAAEKALWTWYLEWSAIVRTTVKDRRALRILGYLQRGPNGEEVVGEEPLPTEPVNPTPNNGPPEPDLPSPFIDEPT